jgi:AcrR family transcriptional regulator
VLDCRYSIRLRSLSTVSPARDSLPLRTALVDTAARLIATEGTRGLTLRRLADEVGTSTMAIYTHFGGMAELRRAIRREGFARLGAHLSTVEQTDDPVADLGVIGLAYYANATANPDLYRVMFMEQPLDADDAAIGWDTFDCLVSGVRRCIIGGRFREAEARDLARELWALDHGVITLQLAELLTPEEAADCIGSTAFKLFTAYGDDPKAATRSLAKSLQRSQVEGVTPTAAERA